MPFVTLPILAIVTTIAGPGIGLGSIVAVACSWDRNHSVVWAIVAGLLSWVYVVYFVVTRDMR